MNKTDVKLQSSVLEVSLDSRWPVIVSYRSVRSSAALSGAADGTRPLVLFFDEGRGEYGSSSAAGFDIESEVQANGKTAAYNCKLKRRGEVLARFEITYSLDGNRLHVRASLKDEKESIQITSIFLPMLSVMASEAGAKLAFPTRSGRLVDVARAEPRERVHKVDWFEPVAIAMAYHDRMLGLLSLNSLDDQIISCISGQPKAGSLTVEFVYRPKAENPELLFLVQKDTSCSVTLLEPDGTDTIDWTAGAAAVRDRVKKNINDLYVGSFIYKILLDRPGAPNWMTFDDALDLIRRINRLTGGARQIVYLVGWQHTGHDTGYPDVFTINPRVGDLNGLRNLIEKAKLENAIVSLHDNYHDAYKDSPAWDPSIIARDSKGELAKGGIWDGGQAYVIGPAKYAPAAVERARRTVEMTGIEKTIHLDVFSDDPDRIDFDPRCPAGRQANIDGKFAVLSAFEELGIDVTSEILTAPFVERMSHFWRVEQRPAQCWSAEERIPLVPMIYHGKVTAGNLAQTDDDLLDLVGSGWTFSEDMSKETADEHISDLYYLVTVPWSILARREITGFEKSGSVERVLYGENSYVQVDREHKTYEIVVDGVTIARDFSTTVQLPDGRKISYFRNRP